MGDPAPLHVDTPSLNWDPAEVTVPPVPLIPAGLDPMSTMISAFLPGLAVPLSTAVADLHAREERFAANLAGARSAYQSADDAGEHEIQAVSSPQGAVTDPASAGSENPATSPGQLMSTAMQVGGQAAQAPMQMMGMVPAAPQGVMQGAQAAMQRLGQLSGQAQKPEDENSGVVDPTATSAEPREQDPETVDNGAGTSDSGAGPGSSSGERVPGAEAGSSITAPRSPTPR
ncbi:MAG: PE domain-containing protein [Actinomycetia bacterium]|nr:PE domain-containing protein [Actinomycetes bacterium]